MERLSRDKMDKETLLKILAEHYDMGTKLFSSLTPVQLQKMYKLPMGMMNGHEFLMLTLDHATHHRAQMEMYLRLNGIKPTAYTF
jgi:uncharacterized damage-inducible protein DinB